jgi:3-oxoacyl-[acyl-carrier-protein] synthase-1
MSRAERIFITGYSALSAGGHHVDEHWDALMAGVTKTAPSREYDLSTWENQMAGELANFDMRQALPDRKLLKVISKQDVMGLYAAIQAANQSGLTDFLAEGLSNDLERCDRTGVFVGSPGNKYFQQYDFLPLVAQSKGDMQYFAKHLNEEVHPMWLLRILPNNVLAYTGIQLGCKGINHNITNHAVGGMQALIEAYWAIQTGQADRVVVVAYDIGTEPQARYYYEKLGVLSATELAPFDQRHDGTILAEGAAALVLESEASMKARGAKPLAEFLGGKYTTEGAGLFGLQDDGQPLATLMQAAMEQCHVQTNDIQMLVAHANGNQKSDNSEALAIASTFGEKGVPVTGFKWLMGHTLCAAGLIDVALAVKALSENTIPHIPNFKRPAAHVSALDVVTAPRKTSLDATAMIVNRGFGGMNAVALLKAVEIS